MTLRRIMEFILIKGHCVHIDERLADIDSMYIDPQLRPVDRVILLAIERFDMLALPVVCEGLLRCRRENGGKL